MRRQDLRSPSGTVFSSALVALFLVHCGGSVRNDTGQTSPIGGAATAAGGGNAGGAGGASTGGAGAANTGGTGVSNAGGSVTGTSGSAGSGGAPVGDPCKVLSACTYLAYDAAGAGFNRNLFAVRTDGKASLGEPKQLTTGAANDMEPTFAPDGATIAFTSDRSGTLQIHLLQLTTGDITQVTSLPGGAQQPAFSTSGKLLAFHSGASVYTIGIDGSALQVIATGPDTTNAYRHPTFPPDGVSLVFDRGNEVDRVSLSGGPLKQLVPNTTDTEEMPSLSPDGVSLAFATYCDDGIESVWIIPAAGIPTSQFACNVAKRVSPKDGASATRPAWGPLGAIAFEHHGATVTLDAVHSDGSADTLVSEKDPRNPAWAPVGTVLP